MQTNHNHSVGHLLVLSLMATLIAILMWLLGFHAENRKLYLIYQADSLKSRRNIS